MGTDDPVQVLRGRLGKAGRLWQRERARTLGWRIAPVFCVVVVAALVCDAFWQLEANTRMAWFAGTLSGLVVLLGVVWRMGRRANPPERVARHLESRDPALGSRVINALQLSAQATDRRVPALTRSLAAQAVDRNNRELAGAAFDALAVTGEARARRGKALRAGAALVVLLAVFFPVTRVLLPRFLDPYGDHPPYAFTRVEIVDPGEAGAEVVYGGKLTVRAVWGGHEPRELFLSAHPAGHPEQVVMLPMIRDHDGFWQEIGDVRNELVVFAHSKTQSYFSHRREIRVLLTPRIEQAWIETSPPAYTGLEPRERPYAFKPTSALIGSHVRFRLRSNRPLSEGVLELTRENGETETIALTPVAEHEVAGSFMVLENVRLRFRVTDTDRIPSDAQPEALLTVTHDLAPLVEIVTPQQNGFVSVAYKLPAHFRATDDFGIKTLRLHRALNGVYSGPLTIDTQGVSRDAAHTLDFNFADLGVLPGDTVSFFAEAIDTAPDPHLARSRTITMTLISEEDYNDYLREMSDVRDMTAKYQKLTERYQELADEQRKLAEEAATLEQKVREGKASAAELEEAFDRISARQNEINQLLEQLAAQMETFVRENPVYDFERDLAKRLGEEAAQLRQATKANREAMERLARSTTRPDGSRSLSPEQIQRLMQEAKAQADRLGAGDRQLQEDVEQPLGDLAALHDLINDFNLFEQAYLAQQALASQAAAYGDKDRLTREDQLALKELGARQAEIGEVMRQLPGLLRRHCEAAISTFPKAALSGSRLADAIEEGRLAPTSLSATQNMLEGDGRESAELSGRLEREMAALFGQCNGDMPSMGGELDQYLGLTFKNGSAGQSFEQMRQSLKNGLQGGNFPGLARTRGRASGPSSGYSMRTDQQSPVIGSEPPPPMPAEQSSPVPGNMADAAGENPNLDPSTQSAKPDVLQNLNPADRESGATPVDSGAEQYRDVVDEYFRKITRP